MSDETEQKDADSVRGYWEKEYRRVVAERDALKSEAKELRQATAEAIAGSAFICGWEGCVSSLRKRGHDVAADDVELPKDQE